MTAPPSTLLKAGSATERYAPADDDLVLLQLNTMAQKAVGFRHQAVAEGFDPQTPKGSAVPAAVAGLSTESCTAAQAKYIAAVRPAVAVLQQVDHPTSVFAPTLAPLGYRCIAEPKIQGRSAVTPMRLDGQPSPAGHSTPPMPGMDLPQPVTATTAAGSKSPSAGPRKSPKVGPTVKVLGADPALKSPAAASVTPDVDFTCVMYDHRQVEAVDAWRADFSADEQHFILFAVMRHLPAAVRAQHADPTSALARAAKEAGAYKGSMETRLLTSAGSRGTSPAMHPATPGQQPTAVVAGADAGIVLRAADVVGFSTAQADRARQIADAMSGSTSTPMSPVASAPGGKLFLLMAMHGKSGRSESMEDRRLRHASVAMQRLLPGALRRCREAGHDIGGRVVWAGDFNAAPSPATSAALPSDPAFPARVIPWLLGEPAAEPLNDGSALLDVANNTSAAPNLKHVTVAEAEAAGRKLLPRSGGVVFATDESRIATPPMCPFRWYSALKAAAPTAAGQKHQRFTTSKWRPTDGRIVMVTDYILFTAGTATPVGYIPVPPAAAASAEVPPLYPNAEWPGEHMPICCALRWE